MILGGDGYLGWSLGLAFGNRTDYQVVLVDNMIKREWEKEVSAKLLVPFKKPADRLAEYKKIFGKTNIAFEKVELMDQKAVVKVIKKYKPSVIINAAQQPSAPFSMMNEKNAAATFSNNIIGHLNVLWAISETDKNITYIKLGSAGSYGSIDTSFVPLNKIDLSFEYKGDTHKILESWMPMHAGDFYHQSKISDFLISDLCANIWNLKTITVQQATIFGATIEENHAPERHGLSTRFNYDAVFSTVLNRFVCQLAIGHPLTIYGDGKQSTGLISLSDTVDNFLKFAQMDIDPGEHVVVHNYTNRCSIAELATLLEKIDTSAMATHIQNPRKEGAGKLYKKMEVHDVIASQHEDKEAKLELELARLLEFTKRYKNNIDTSVILPKITWSKDGQDHGQTGGKKEYVKAPEFLSRKSAKTYAAREFFNFIVRLFAPKKVTQRQ